MHQIQKLELVGFKSFCDRTQIIFHEGVTAIVGPNGCGKSNISDAVSWVVGEQSAKSLRTDRMEGVIFNGTQARKATSYAEVVLTLSLMDHFSIPEGMALNPDGFTVGRRLYRSGESEYSLDGKRCRLKDIQALFEGTGLGPNSYALIEQGRIGQILSSKPADRRALIEEAARITLFKSRRCSAEMKLEMAQQNLLRVSDIIREVARQLGSLRRQAAKARRYNRLREEFRGLQKLRLGVEARQLRDHLEDCSQRFTAAQEQEQSVLSDLAAAEELRGTQLETCQNQEELVSQTRENLSNLKVDAGNAQNTLENQETQRLGLVLRLRELDRDQQAINGRAQIIGSEQKRLADLAGALNEELAGGQRILDEEQSRSDVLAEAIRQTEGETERLRSDLLNGAGQLSDCRNLQARCHENLQRISAQKARIEEELAVRVSEREVLRLELSDLLKQSDEKLARQQNVGLMHKELERKSSMLAERLEQTSAELTAQQEEHSLMQHRYSSLEEVERRRSNYSEGVQKYLSARIPGEEASPAQTLADHVETDPIYETAVEDYLNDPLQYILVDRLPDAVHSVERLKRIGAGKCTFMTLRNGHDHYPEINRPPLGGDGVVGYLDDLLRMKEEVRQAFERALPEYASTIMVSDLNTAFRVADQHPQANYLTISGESYSPRGMLSAVGERKSMSGFLALKREKRDLESKLNRLNVKIQATREMLAGLKGEQATVAESIKSLAAEFRKLELEVVVAGHEVSRLENEIGKIDSMAVVVNSEILRLDSEKTDFERRLSESAAGISEIEERSRSGSETLKELGARLEALKLESADLARKLAAMTSAQAVKGERLSAADFDLQRLAAESEDVRRRGETGRAEKDQASARIVDIELAQKDARARIEECGRQLLETEGMLAVRQRDLSAQREALTEIERRLRQLHAAREETMGARSKIEIEKTRLESDIGHLEQNSLEEFHSPLDQLISGIEASDWQRNYEAVQAQYNELKEKIENYGAINMRALEEYQELDERYQFLNNQRADIEQSIADTQKAIADINRRSAEQFEEAFNAIRRNFIDVFQLLFTGGQCDLRLLDDDDLLESGVDIIAQPPGKRLQNVLLLSGGEKALTALALLIAIFRYRPSPFCVLDEVDAPLDDANVDRFTKLISELSKETQFIIVTHNKKTMEMAQTLYGVTMEEPGISKILGVDFRRRSEALAS